MPRGPGRRDDRSKRPEDIRPPTDSGLALPCPFPGCNYVARSPRAQLKLDSHVDSKHRDSKW